MAAKDLRAFLRTAADDSASRLSGPGSATSSTSEPSTPALHAVVLRSPVGYACGQCRSEYRAFSDASECLQRCTVRLRLGKSVHVLASPAGDVFQCSLCARVRVHREDALRCFERCHHLLTHEIGVPKTVLDALKPLRPAHSHDGASLFVEARPSLRRGPLFRGGSSGWVAGANEGLHISPVDNGSMGASGGSGGSNDTSIASNGAHRASETSAASDTTAQARLRSAAAERLLGSPLGADGRKRNGQSDQAGRPTPLSPSEVERRTRELLEGDLPAGALVQDADGFGVDEESSPGSPSGIMDADLGLEGLSSPTESSAESSVDSNDMDALMAAEPEVPTAPTELKRRADGSIIMRKPRMKPFKRADARYLCGACESRFFTKNEAEVCFMAHPLDDMV